MQRVSETVVALLRLYGSKNVGSETVCVFVTCVPHILLQAADNRDAISETKQPTNACIGRRVCKHRNT
jgi:hypothetical protein